MTKSKKFVSRMMFALVVLTLVSFCFVGFTFARYTTGGSMDAAAKVAVWKITATEHEGAETLDFGTISPEMDVYAEGSVRENHIEKNVVKITNESDVAAKLTVNVTDPAWTIDETALNSLTKKADGSAFGEGEDKKAYVQNLINKHIKITYKYTVDTADAADYTPGTTEVTLESGAEHTFVLKATLTWTSDIDGVNGDAEDTVIGQCVKGFTYTVSYRADQATEHPVNG